MPMNVRIRVGDLTEVCRTLNSANHNVTVLASGSVYATLKLFPKARICLANSRYFWEFD